MKKLNLKNLSLALIIFSILISGILMESTYSTLKNQSVKTKQLFIHNLLSTLQNSLDFFANDFVKNTKFLSSIYPINHPLSVREEIFKQYILSTTNNSRSNTLLQLDTSGTVVFAYPNKKFIGLNLNIHESIKKAVKEKKATVSNIFTTTFGNSVIAVTVPIFYNGKYKGAIVNMIPFRYLNKTFLNSLKFKKKDVNFYLLDGNKNIVFSSVNKDLGEPFFESPNHYSNFSKFFKNLHNIPSEFSEINFRGINSEKNWEGFIMPLNFPKDQPRWFLLAIIPDSFFYVLLHEFLFRLLIIGGFATLGILLSALIYFFTVKKYTKQLEEKEHKFNVMAQITGQIMFKKEIETEDICWFSNVETMLGYEHDEFNNFTVEQIRELIHPDDRDKVIKNEKLILNSPFEFTKIEYRIRKKNGDYIYVEEVETLLYDDKGNAFQILGSLRDISANKENEAKILEYQKNLEELVERRTKALELTLSKLNSEIEVRKKKEKELEKSMKKVEAANKLKSEFLAQISHEVRTPINIIVSHISLFKMELGDEVPEDLEYSIKAISKASNRLIRTIELIVNAADIHTGSYEPHYNTWDIYDQILRKLFYDFIPQAEAKSLALTMEEPQGDTKVYVDEYSVRHIFINLLDNAIKYTTKGKISVKIFRNEEDKLTVEISDTGIGIDEKYVPYLFEIFSQEHSGYTRKYDGNGLGLTLVKAYCDINNIEIKLDTKKNEGTTFTLIFNGVEESEA